MFVLTINIAIIHMNYWIFVQNFDNWKLYEKFVKSPDNKLLLFFSNNDVNIEIKDIVIIYVRILGFSGFYGYVKISSEIMFNDTFRKVIKYDNENAYKFYCELKCVNIFKTFCGRKMMNDDVLIKFYTLQSRTKNKDTRIIKINNEYGEGFMNCFENVSYASYYYKNGEKVFKNVNKNEEIKEKEKEEEEKDKKIKKDKEKDKEKDKDKEEEKDEKEDEKEEKEEKDKEDEKEDEEIKEKKKINAYIPILLSPCEKLLEYEEENDKKVVKKIIKHYLNCKKCDRTNNNKIEITNLLFEKKVSLKILDDTELIDEYLEYYLTNTKKETGKKIVIYKIEDYSHDNNNDFLIIL